MAIAMRDQPSIFTRANWGGPSKPVSKNNTFSPYFSGLVVLCVIAGFVVVQAWPAVVRSIALNIPPSSTEISVRVIDGDTVSLNDGKPDVRLVGFNAPETGRNAQCEAELHTGEAARRRLKELVVSGRPAFREITCSCAPNVVHCNYGRRCGTLAVDGYDVGAILIGEGLAAPFVCSARSCPPLPRPWC